MGYDYNKRQVWVNVVRMFAEGIDTDVTAHMTIPQGGYDDDLCGYPCVTVLMHGMMEDQFTVYVYKTNDHGYCDMTVDAPDEYKDYDMYGDSEVGLHPDEDANLIESVDVNGLQEFMAICQKYMK